MLIFSLKSDLYSIGLIATNLLKYSKIQFRNTYLTELLIFDLD